MIKVNNRQVKVEHFPDGTQRMNLKDIILATNGRNLIRWNYENDAELLTIIYVTEHIKDSVIGIGGSVSLLMPYLPNARMDRVHVKRNEVFTLKYFCKVINSLQFDFVHVLDPHSDVGVALLDRCFTLDVAHYITTVIGRIYLCAENLRCSPNEFLLYFPDAGATKKYSVMIQNMAYCWGEKKRDWDTGNIIGLEVRTNNNESIKGKIILMVDDIVSYGGSLYHSALKLKELGADKIYAYASHTENSVLDREKGTLIKALEDNIVERLFTTNSLFTGNHEKITVLEVQNDEKY